LTERGGREVEDDEAFIMNKMSSKIIPDKPGKPKEIAPEITKGNDEKKGKV
jgi:hypothetical protein